MLTMLQTLSQVLSQNPRHDIGLRFVRTDWKSSLSCRIEVEIEKMWSYLFRSLCVNTYTPVGDFLYRDSCVSGEFLLFKATT